jgi:hypothetical protein
MGEQDWTPFKVTQEHLTNLVSQGFMTVTELMTYHMPKDPVAPVPVEGYVVSFMAFYERRISVPSHQFLCSLLQHYHLELNNLTPSGSCTSQPF